MIFFRDIPPVCLTALRRRGDPEQGAQADHAPPGGAPAGDLSGGPLYPGLEPSIGGPGVRVVLAMAMVVTMVGTAFAKEENVDIAMQNEIDARMDIIMEDVYRQLEAQDGLVYLDVYEEFFLANVTHEVMMEYGIQTMDTDGKVNYSLRNGGAIYYKSPVPDAEASELVVTCLDRQRTLDYILDKESFSVGTIIESIVGNLGEIGSATGFVLTLRSFADAAAKSSIKKAGGYTKIVNTYNPTYKEGASIVTGWSDHPFVVTPSDSYDHHVERFPEYVEP